MEHQLDGIKRDDIVVADNVAFHKVAGVEEAIRVAGSCWACARSDREGEVGAVGRSRRLGDRRRIAA
jgi:hypothetical protein